MAKMHLQRCKVGSGALSTVCLDQCVPTTYTCKQNQSTRLTLLGRHQVASSGGPDCVVGGNYQVRHLQATQIGWNSSRAGPNLLHRRVNFPRKRDPICRRCRLHFCLRDQSRWAAASHQLRACHIHDRDRPASAARGATGVRASFSVERAVVVLGGVGAQSSNGEGLVEVAASARRRRGRSLERSAIREGPVEISTPREPEAKPSLPRPPTGSLSRSLRLLPQSPSRSRQRRRCLSERGAPPAVNGNSTAGVACCRRR
jgi:hypothetical protein